MRVLILAGLLMVMGCGVTPRTAIKSINLEGEKIIYFEQSDRIPKDALIEAIKAHATTSAVPMRLQMLSPEVIAGLVKELISVAPEFSKVYSNERMNEAMIGRRILIKGYGTNELWQVIQVIEALDGCFEKWTP